MFSVRLVSQESHCKIQVLPYYSNGERMKILELELKVTSAGLTSLRSAERCVHVSVVHIKWRSKSSMEPQIRLFASVSFHFSLTGLGEHDTDLTEVTNR